MVLLLVCFLFNTTKAFADVVDYVPHKMTVQFEQAFSSNNPVDEFSVIITDDYENVKDYSFIQN